MTDFFQTLRGLYAAIDAELTESGVACKQCAACGDPHGAWLVPQPSLLEVDLIRRSLQSARLVWPEVETDGACLFLAEGACTIYEVRPFHCRIFAYHGKSRSVHLRWKTKVENLCADYAHARGKPFSAYPFSMYSIVSRVAASITTRPPVAVGVRLGCLF